MYFSDLSAIDKLIDFYGENLKVNYHDIEFNIYELRNFFEDKNINFSLDKYLTKIDGIYDQQGNKIISILNLHDLAKDDLIGI